MFKFFILASRRHQRYFFISNRVTRFKTSVDLWCNFFEMFFLRCNMKKIPPSDDLNFVTSFRFLNNQRQRLSSFGWSVLKVESFASSEFRGQHWGLCLDLSLRGKVSDNLLERPTPQLCQLYNFLSVSATCSCGIKRVIIGFRCCCQPKMGTLYLTNAVDSLIEYFSGWNLTRMKRLTPLSRFSTVVSPAAGSYHHFKQLHKL